MVSSKAWIEISLRSKMLCIDFKINGKTETHDSLRIIAPLFLLSGSDFSCHVKFGDERSRTLKRTKTQYYADGPGGSLKPYRNMRFKMSHLYPDIYLYR